MEILQKHKLMIRYIISMDKKHRLGIVDDYLFEFFSMVWRERDHKGNKVELTNNGENEINVLYGRVKSELEARGLLRSKKTHS